ncbi:hypothetical protein [uncultured Rikenella sp.]|uniref:hypothetical protein n=1 Tax=uncultured Rikenella sp. TaxID=368003 RepID=UPI00263008A3|nr:hypothetical protein [uncultured Rikenella sp.]
MKKQKKARILNANKYLPFYLQEGERFYVGLLYEDFVKSTNLRRYNIPANFQENLIVTPAPKGSVTRANVYGKYVRKYPEEKTIKTVHISYNRRDGAYIEYDRDFNVYVKELAHKFQVCIHFKTNKHGQKVVVAGPLIYNDDVQNVVKNTHVINLFCEIFNDFEVFTADLEPAIHFNKRFAEDLLPQGTLSEEKTMNELLEFAGRYTKNEDVKKAFQKRLHILERYAPDIRGKGPSNFFGYIVFGFSDLKIVVLETMYAGNATYVFRLEDYEKNVIKDKQTVIKNKIVLRRFYHYDDWENQLTTYLDTLKKNM